MSLAALNQAVETLKGLLEERGVTVTRIGPHGRRTERVVGAQLASGAEISLVADFCIYADKVGQVNAETMLGLFWPRAEGLRKECWGPLLRDERELPRKMRDRIRKAREAEYPVAHLSIVQDPAYFRRPPPSFAPSETAALASHLAGMVHVVVRRVIPTYSRYCDADTLVSALLSPATKGEFWLLPLYLGPILAASGKSREFTTWRSSREQEIEADPNLSPEVRERNKQYLQALASRAIRR
jgi:hypothetical protein